MPCEPASSKLVLSPDQAAFVVEIAAEQPQKSPR
jgi:hypothetical protein